MTRRIDNYRRNSARGPRPSASPSHRATRESFGPSATGLFTVHPRGFGFVALDGEDDVFVPASVLRGRHLHAGDTVSVRYNEDNRAAYAITLLSCSRSRVFGTVEQASGTWRLRLDPWVGADPLIVKSSQAAAAGLTVGDGVLVTLGSGEVEGFGPHRRPRAQHRRALERFSLAELDTDVAVPDDPHSVPASRRADLRDVVTFTIDGPESRDLDDAISVEARGDVLRLSVHIADVAAAVPEGSPADRRARRLATSVYLPGLSVPMFPPALSYDACSLLEGRDRRALSVSYDVHPDGRVDAVELAHTLIRSDAQLTYVEVAEHLSGTTPLERPAALVESIELVHEATGRLAVARRARGGLLDARPVPGHEIAVRDDQVVLVEPDGADVAHDLIEEAMVAANEAVATWLIERSLPGIYRVHTGPGEEARAALVALAESYGVTARLDGGLTPQALAQLEESLSHVHPTPPLWQVVMSNMDRAVYQVAPDMHFGLASEAYVHFTSPIRRYADLTVHRIITAHLLARPLPDVADLNELCGEINAGSSLAARAETASRSLLWASYFLSSARHHRSLPAQVVKVAQKGIVVALADYDASGWILARDLDSSGVFLDEHGLTLEGNSSGTWRLGDSVMVDLIDIDDEAGQLSFRRASAVPASTSRGR